MQQCSYMIIKKDGILIEIKCASDGNCGPFTVCQTRYGGMFSLKF